MIRLFHPEVYQGPKNLIHKKEYFEGWYYKFVSPGDKALAVIPGVSLSKEKVTVFIQIIDGTTGKTSYKTFRPDELHFTYKPFSISIGDNFFSLEKVKLGDRIPLTGEVHFNNRQAYGVSLTRPGIMGWYRYVPAMECYHGVVSCGHDLRGSLTLENSEIPFDKGSGYIEKDWGTSFPESYIWMQSNKFSEKRTSFMLSAARIPWFGSFFRGFLGFLELGDKLLTFSTYTGANLHIDSQGEHSVSIIVQGNGPGWNNSLKKGEKIRIRASRKAVGLLMAPAGGSMKRRIGESIDGEIDIEYTRGDKILYKGQSFNSGLEIVGNLQQKS